MLGAHLVERQFEFRFGFFPQLDLTAIPIVTIHLHDLACKLDVGRADDFCCHKVFGREVAYVSARMV